MSLIHVFAQAAVAAAPQPAPASQFVAPAPATQGMSSYPAAFFAGQQVANAYEMLGRVPGFSLDTGDSVRGFEGAAGNVLVDGQRPTSKTDGLDQILIPSPPDRSSASTSSAAARRASTCRASRCWPM